MQKQKELFWSLCCDQKKEREKRLQSVDTTLAEKMETESLLVLISVLVTKVHHVQGVKKRSDFRRLRLSLMTPNAGDEDRFRLL